MRLDFKRFKERRLRYMTPTGKREHTAGMTIQQVSRLSGMSEPTLRYYEKIGLIDAVDRDDSSGHRRYGPAAVATIEALSCLRTAGMSVREMRAYLRFIDTRDAARLRELFQHGAERLADEIDRMRVRLDYLRLKADIWGAREHGDAEAERRAIAEITPVVSGMVADEGRRGTT